MSEDTWGPSALGSVLDENHEIMPYLQGGHHFNQAIKERDGMGRQCKEEKLTPLSYYLQS